MYTVRICIKRSVSGHSMEDTVTNNMKNKPRLKRVLAREILLFFAGLVLIGLAWSFLLIRNSYYENKVNSYSHKIKTLQIQNDSLPKDYIKEFYDKVSRYFVVRYTLGQDSLAIVKEKEQTFLYDEFGIKKNVTLLPNHPTGYEYFYADNFKDSIVLFDFVSIEKFREFVSSDVYQNKLYSVFSKNPDNKELVPPLPLGFTRVEYDPKKPYKDTFSLGTLSDFKFKMNNGLKFNSTIVEKKNKIISDIADFKETITDSKNNKLSPSEVSQNVIFSALVIGLLLYVLRLSIILIFWAIRTMKSNK